MDQNDLFQGGRSSEHKFYIKFIFREMTATVCYFPGS